MTGSPSGPRGRGPADHRVLTYVADLDVEFDRLRWHTRLIHQEARRPRNASGGSARGGRTRPRCRPPALLVERVTGSTSCTARST